MPLKSVWAILSVFVFVLSVGSAWAQDTSKQIWLSFILGHEYSDKLYLEVEIQPKKQTSTGERWRNLDTTWLMEYYPNKWLDLTGEVVAGYTNQKDDLDSIEITPRAGIRLHFIEQQIQALTHKDKVRTERVPVNRFYLACWMRMELRNFYYFGELDSSHEVRFRIRPEFKAAINNKSLGDDKTLFFRTDVEAYFPIDDVPERFTNKLRFRGDFGYRIDETWRAELLYVHDVYRDSPIGEFEEDANILDFRLVYRF